MRPWLLVEACWLLLQARREAGRHPEQTAAAFARPAAGAAPARPHAERLLGRVQAELWRAERWLPWRVTCLERTVALHRMLARRGIATRPVIGVRKEGAELEAHAWLEHEGRILNGSAAHCGRYHPLA